MNRVAPPGESVERLQQPFRVNLLGVMRAVSPSGDSILPRAKKTQAVVAYLCLAGGHSILRSRIAGIIWDCSGELQARDSLRNALRELDRLGWPIEIDPANIRLDLDGCWIDAFETPERPDLLLDSLCGVSSSFDQWLIGERIRFENRWQSILEKSLEDLASSGAAPDMRAAAARRLLSFIPTHEPAIRHLMTAIVDMDDRAQALREYEHFRTTVTNSLGMPPSQKTVALYEAIQLESRLRRRRPPALPAQSIGPHFEFDESGVVGVAPPGALDRQGNNLRLLHTLHPSLQSISDQIIITLSSGNSPHQHSYSVGSGRIEI